MQETQETEVPSLGQKDPLEKEMATHSSILAWEIAWTEEPSRLHPMGSQKSWTRLSEHTHAHLRVTQLLLIFFITISETSLNPSDHRLHPGYKSPPGS